MQGRDLPLLPADGMGEDHAGTPQPVLMRGQSPWGGGHPMAAPAATSDLAVLVIVPASRLRTKPRVLGKRKAWERGPAPGTGTFRSGDTKPSSPATSKYICPLSAR